MSFNNYQQDKVDLLLGTDFKKQYDLIPDEFKNNYWFEEFLFNLASIYMKTEISKEYGRDKEPNPNRTEYFNLSELDGNMNTSIEYTWNGPDCTNKNVMNMTLELDGTLYFKWVFAFTNERLDEYYSSEKDDISYELAMKLSEDKKLVFVEHTTASNKKKPWKCYMKSIFDTSITELYRVSEAIDVETNEVLYHEEFAPVCAIDQNLLNDWQSQAERTPIQLFRIAGGNLNVKQTEHHQNIIQVFVGKCTIGENTRYAICWKPDCFVDKSFQESFQSVVMFGAPGLHLSHQLYLKEQPWLIEISEEDYNNLIGFTSEKEQPQFKKILK